MAQMKRLDQDALIAKQEMRTHFDGLFLTKLDFAVKKVQKIGPLFTVFPDFFQNGT